MLSKEIVGASTIPIILSILSNHEDYGYQIIQKVKEYSGGHLEWSEPMLYPVLHRMERNQLIKSQWRNLENGRKRKYYSILPKGVEALEDKKDEWIQVIALLGKMWDFKVVPA